MEAATARTASARPASVLAGGGPLNRLRGDRKLVERFQAGDEGAFATLYDRHRTRLTAIAIGVLGSVHDAQDAVQDAFISAAASLRTSTPDDVRAWLSRVARNAAIDVARGRRPTVEVTPGDAIAAGPSRDAELRVELVDLVDALKDLPERQRTALVMRELSGASYADIGATLGADEVAVRGLIARARISLRAAREARAIDCASVRERLAVEIDGRRRTAEMRRHLRGCVECRRFQSGLKDDAKALRGLFPAAGVVTLIGVLASLKATRPLLVGGIVIKGLGGTQAAQIVAACLVCAGAAEGVREIAVRASAPPPAPAKADRPATAVEASAPLAAASAASNRSEAPPGPRPASGPGAAERRVARGARRRAALPPRRERSPAGVPVGGDPGGGSVGPGGEVEGDAWADDGRDAWADDERDAWADDERDGSGRRRPVDRRDRADGSRGGWGEARRSPRPAGSRPGDGGADGGDVSEDAPDAAIDDGGWDDGGGGESFGGSGSAPADGGSDDGGPDPGTVSAGGGAGGSLE